MFEPFTQWGVPLRATSPRPAPSRPGLIVRMTRATTRHAGEPAWHRFIETLCDNEKETAALAEMPDDWPLDVMPRFWSDAEMGC